MAITDSENFIKRGYRYMPRRWPTEIGGGGGGGWMMGLEKSASTAARLTPRQMKTLKAIAKLDPKTPFWKQEEEYRKNVGAAAKYMKYEFKRIQRLEAKGLIERVRVGIRGGLGFRLSQWGEVVLNLD
jgi:hypothetical protein